MSSDLKLGVSILAIGSEILDGRVQDSNSNFIAQELQKYGLTLDKILVCDDKVEEIIASIKFLERSCRFLIISGGLGPTTDDLTREGVSSFLEVPLIERPESIERLKILYAKRQRTLDPSNHKQALFPSTSKPIANNIGTAEGFHISKNLNAKSFDIFSLPGVPKELTPMFFDYVLPKIQDEYKVSQGYRRSFRIFGIPESDVGSKIKSLNLRDTIFVSYRASFPEIHITLKGNNPSEIDDAFIKCKNIIEESYIFVEDQEISLPETVCNLLLSSNITISVAESCTGGMLGSYLTSASGSSKYFLGGYMTYSNKRKTEDLLVSNETLSTYGAVSQECAIEMANGCRVKTGSDIAISITGIAGPEGGSQEKPVGTFYIAISDRTASYAERYFFLSDRAAIRKMASYRALDTIRRHIFPEKTVATS